MTDRGERALLKPVREAADVDALARAEELRLAYAADVGTEFVPESVLARRWSLP